MTMGSAQKDAIPRRVRAAVYRRDGRQCRYCGTRRGPFELDHVYPESKGGATTLENLVVACEKCNRQKSAKVGIWPLPIGYFAEREAMQEEYERHISGLQREIERRGKIVQRMTLRIFNPPIPQVTMPTVAGLVVFWYGVYLFSWDVMTVGLALVAIGLLILSLSFVVDDFGRMKAKIREDIERRRTRVNNRKDDCE